ncbi:MAG: adenine phosphoribosyltransferase [Calditrichales bacterium]|nr:MAG: adenine phosphoribosyltransferase [Calditrichales bacterium]
MEISEGNKLSKALRDAIRDVPDFPKKGIIFKDITTVLNDAELFKQSIDQLIDLVRDCNYTAVAAIESRGFIFGAALAYQMHLKFVPIRKPGKLPAKTISEEYKLEYGVDRIEIHSDALDKKDQVLLIDDLLATGGTARASCTLIEKLGAHVQTILFLVELEFLNGRNILAGHDVRSLVQY